MLCPNCADRPLETVKTSSGPILRCPDCLWFFIPWAALSVFSTDPGKFLAAIEETQALRLPTSRLCAQCGFALQQGRVRTAGVVVTLCPTCQSLWIDFEALERLDEAVAYSFKLYLQKPSAPPGPAPHLPKPSKAPVLPPEGPSASFSPAPAMAAEWEAKQTELLQRYAALEKELRTAWEKREAELSQRQAAELKKAQEEFHQALEKKLNTAGADALKRLEAFQVHMTELEQKRHALETEIQRLHSRMETLERERAQRGDTQAKQEADISRRYAEELKKNQAAMDSLLEEKLSTAETEHRKQLETMQQSLAEMERSRSQQEMALKAARSQPAPVEPPPQREIPKEIPKAVPKAEPKLPVLPKPVQPAPVVKAPAKNSTPFWKELVNGLKSAWNPTAVKRPATPGVKPAVIAPKPAEKPVVVETPPPVKTPEPLAVKALEPRAAAAAPAVSASPKKAAVQAPTPGLDMMIGWTPRVLPLLTFLIVKVATYEGDTALSLAWALILWSVSAIVRLFRMYPSKPLTSGPISGLSGTQGATTWRGVPVTLNGHLVSGGTSKGLVFEDSSGTIALNRIGKLEVFPYIFGLSSAGQFPQGEFTLTGWLRRRPDGLFIEAGEARNEKSHRKSLVKPLRWTLVVFFLVTSVIFLFANDPGF